MKKLLAVTLAVFLGAWATGSVHADGSPAESEDREGAEYETLNEKASYTLGFRIGTNFKAQEADFDLDIMLQGIRDALEGAEPGMTHEDMDAAWNAFEEELSEKAAKRFEEQKRENVAKSAQFLEENAKAEGVVTTRSGLQYKVLHEGAGPKPSAADQVEVHYRGTLIDGTEFDSSYRHGSPARFPVGGVIPGWVEALQLMKAGSKWQLWIPASLAYGETPPPGSVIGPNALLIFEVELLSVEGKG